VLRVFKIMTTLHTEMNKLLMTGRIWHLFFHNYFNNLIGTDNFINRKLPSYGILIYIFYKKYQRTPQNLYFCASENIKQQAF
jgi:hypothetical protein